MTFLRKVKHRKSKIRQSGFSLVELLVAISIVTILSAMLVFQQSNFDSSIYLKNLAYEVSLTIREAQLYAIRGQSEGGIGCDDGELDCPYGVYFDKTEDNQSLILFRDRNRNGEYDDGEAIEEFAFEHNNSIQNICDSASGPCNEKTELHVTFDRPSPAPLFSDSSIDDARIIFENRDGTTVTVTMLASGQIAVEQ